MNFKTLRFWLPLLVLILSSCFLLAPEEIENPVDDLKDEIGQAIDDQEAELEKQRAEVAAEIEAEIMAYLECSEKIRPSTIERIQAVLNDPNEDTLIDLLTAPDDLAQLVSMAGVQVEGAVILIRNLNAIYEAGHVATLIEGGWESEELTCEDVIEIACTAGTGSTTVVCDEADAILEIQETFEGCMLGGTKYEGGVSFTRSDVAEVFTAGVRFQTLTFDEVDIVEGGFELEIDAVEKSQDLALLTGEIFTMTSHGGPTGASCGEQLTLSTMRVYRSESEGRVELDGEYEDVESAYEIKTVGEHLVFPAPFECACPTPGSGLEFTFSTAFENAAEDATVQILYGEPADETFCASVSVDVSTWPTDCSFLENVQEDCGKAALQKMLAPLLEAFCIVDEATSND